MATIAIIDTIGLTYDGNTLSKRGLGGSESAVILISKELSKLGFDVTVFNSCIDKEATPGIYDGVLYRDLTELDKPNDLVYDIVISSRTVIPFLHPSIWSQFPELHPERFANIKNNAKFRAVWMHDTFCRGDHLLEPMLTHGDIHEIFTLSDFHTSYVTNCDHGSKRMFEVIKRFVFQTRNGIVNYNDEVDITSKDPFLYVYNASVTKGMLPLVESMWSRIKSQIPQAKLKVIGGYYRFRENAKPDDQEVKWRALVADPKYSELDIEFTGIIKQSEIAEILAKASFFLLPGAFPETFGISSLEALAYNTPIITTRFGALEETAVDLACYKIDYPIEPNGLFPNVNKNDQENRYIDLLVRAHHDRYLHQQKMYYCNIIKDICTWDTVALQWKQHLFKKLGLYLTRKDYQKVSAINAKVHEVFGRKFSNTEENYLPRNTQQKIVVITPMYNAEQYIEKCIESVISQDYDNWEMHIVDDASGDRGFELAKKYALLDERVHVVRNGVNKGAVYNQITTIRNYCDDDDIVMLIDGDDSLINDNQIFHRYNNLFDGSTEFSYGSCWSMVDNIPLVSQPYPEKIKQDRSYRDHKFNWNMPYTHLRAFKAYLLNDIDDSAFKDEDDNWYKAGGDGSVFYSLIEQADPSKVKVVQNIVYNYNDTSPINDYKVNGDEQTKNANRILQQKNKLSSLRKKNKVKSILIAIPTNMYIEPDTFKSVYDLEVPDNYTTDFQYFYGYQVDQIRNLIAHWATHYDYLFAVDSDIVFAKDTLTKMLQHDVDMVSGIYRQRKADQQVLEIYKNGTNMEYKDLHNKGLVEIDGCGFGCVLIKSEVIKAVGYPQFVYKSAINHKDTISEDTYFCHQAKLKGYKIYTDTSILCDHIGKTKYVVEMPVEVAPQPSFNAFDRLMELSNTRLLPRNHLEYLYRMRDEFNIKPKVIYDIGACVLHWTREAINVWNDAQFFAFEGMPESEDIFKYFKIPYNIGVLSSETGKEVDFIQNTYHPGGNSYYAENTEINPTSNAFYEGAVVRKVKAVSLDDVVSQRGFPAPDLIKMDVQGAELDILKGAQNTLKSCNDVILELQKVEYNKGAPLRGDVIAYMETIGFRLTSGPFSEATFDGDYHFTRK